MTGRRQFLGKAAFTGLALGGRAPVQPQDAGIPARQDTRTAWVAMLGRVAGPVITALAANELKKRMPVETKPGEKEGREPFTHLEALGRTLAGIAPWLACKNLSGEEKKERAKFVALARQCLEPVRQFAKYP